MISRMREIIVEQIYAVADESGLHVDDFLHDDLNLLESGLDSLGFAILVVRLEEELGFDPFTLAADAYYPSTLGSFVRFYDQNQPH